MPTVWGCYMFLDEGVVVKSIPGLLCDIPDLPRVLQQAFCCFRGEIDGALAWNLWYDAFRAIGYP